jgi:UDP-N-acetylmuramate--alanine ligase
MLAELMRLKWSIAVGGTHGKTTTTSLVAAVLEGAGYDPTVINGGIINAYGSNTRLGAGDWMVVEADESDGSFLRLPSVITIVTNMDPEHLDHWGTREAMEAGYRQFVSNIPFYGFAVLCIDHPAVQQMIPSLSDHRVITYGFSPQADVRAERIMSGRDGATFEVRFADRATGRARRIGPFKLPMLGNHNVQNALAAIAVANEMEIGEAQIKAALLGFAGVKRRFTKTGESGGVTVIDDYGHHPVEIAAVLKAARQAGARDVVAVVQPHRFTRLQTLFEEFCTCMNDAGHVIVADVYPAGEAPIEGVDRDAAERSVASGGDGARHGAAWGFCRLPRRRQHHQLGERAAGGVAGFAGADKAMSKKELLFLKKKKQKNFCHLARWVTRLRVNEQTFFASFFQKRSACFV